MYRVFRAEHYDKKFSKLDNSEQSRISKIEQSLKENPFTGKPLGYTFLREKKLNGKRILFLVYSEYQTAFLITITDKKAQQQEIDLIKSHLEVYKDELKEKLEDLSDFKFP